MLWPLTTKPLMIRERQVIDLDKLEELERSATPRPWHLAGGTIDDDTTAMIEHGSYDVGECSNEDASLLCTLRNALPALIAELRAARAVVDAAKGLYSLSLVDHLAYMPFDVAIAAYDQEVNREV